MEAPDSKPPRPARALHVDDHHYILDAVGSVLTGAQVVSAVTPANTLAAALETLERDADYDAIILDLKLNDADGLEGLKSLRERYPAIPVLVLSATEDPLTICTALVAGARGYVSKNAKPAILKNALGLVLAGSTYVPPELFATLHAQLPELLREQAAASRPEPELQLTPRQVEVLRLLLAGHSNKVIGARLGMAEGTVKTHLNGVFRSLQVRNRAQAVLQAHKRGMR